MPKYTVIVTRDITESAIVEIDAPDETQAKLAALAHIQETEQPVSWEADDPSMTSVPYVTDVSPL